MQQYAGLDVSPKEISICVVDRDGKTIARGTCPADPEGMAGWLRNRSLGPHRIVHQSGMLSIWLQRGMARLGLPATCIGARKAHKSLSARLTRSDAADAEGLAQLARTGWFTPVHIRSEEADRRRRLVAARERLIRLRKDLEGHIRGVLKPLGIRMIGMGLGRHRQAFRDQLAAAGEIDSAKSTGRDVSPNAVTARCAGCFSKPRRAIRQVKRFSTLKSRAVRLAGQRGFRKAAVATARKIAGLMLTPWKTETDYQWTKEATA